MTAKCQRCKRPVIDAHVCVLCGRDLQRALVGVPMLEVELDLTISKQRRFTTQSDGAGSSDQPLPVNLQASNAAGHLRAILVGWTRLYVDETTVGTPAEGPAHDDCLHLTCSRIRVQRDPWPTDTLAGMGLFLLSHAEWLRHHEAAFDCVDEVTEAVRRAQLVIDTPANRARFPVGPCPEVDVIGTPCPGEVWATIPAVEYEPAWMGCGICGQRYDPVQWHRAGRRILQRRDQLRRLVTLGA